ncbi:MAG: DUF6263 family protein [Limisphaerales bacterium]
MRNSSNRNPLSGAVSRTRPEALKWLSSLVLLVLLMALWPARAEDPEDQYQRMYMLIQQADSLDAGGQTGPALAKYREAQTVLRGLKNENPRWNPDAVSYRYNYLAGKIAALAQKAAKPAAASPTRAAQEAQAEAKPSSADSRFQAKLLNAGAEPRKVLRLHPQAGDKQTLNLTMKIAMDIQIAGMPGQTMKLPTIRMAMDTTVKSVSPDGGILYDLTIGNAEATAEADANPQMAQLMKSVLSGFKGLSGSGTTSDRGFSKGTEIKMPAGADPQLRQMVDQMRDSFGHLSVSLPEEAVGPGARWEVKMAVKAQGMTIDQNTVYQLGSIEGDRVTVKETVEQHASNQKIQNPAMPGVTLDLTKMTGKGGGDLTFDLGRLLPGEGTSTFSSEAVMQMNAGGQKTSMTTKTTQNLRIGGKSD